MVPRVLLSLAKSLTPTIVPSLVTCALLALVVAGCGGGSSDDSDSGAKPGATSDADRASDTPAATESTPTEPPIDRMQAEYIERRNTCTSVEDHSILARWCRSHNRTDQEKLQWQRVLRLDPTHVAAHEALGHEKYTVPNELAFSVEYRGELADYDGTWQSPEKMANVRELESEIRARVEASDARAESDPWFADVRRAIQNKLSDISLTGSQTRVELVDPFLVIWQGPKDDDDEDAADGATHGDTEASDLDAELAAVRTALERVLASYEDLCGDDVGEDADRRALPVMIFRDRASRDVYHKSRSGSEPDAEDRVVYEPRSRDLTGYRTSDDPPVSFERDVFLTDLAAGAARQLLHARTEGNDEPRALWVRRGVPSYLAPPPDEVTAKTSPAPGGVHDDLVQICFDAAGREQLFGLFDLLGYLDERRADRDAAKLDPEAFEIDPDAFHELLDAQSWLLAHFLLHAEGGKYREPFRKYLTKERNGEGGRTEFGKAFELKLRDDYAPMESALRKYAIELTYAD